MMALPSFRPARYCRNCEMCIRDRGIRTQAEKKEVASAWLELAISCAKVPVKYEADEIKRRQKEEKTQREMCIRDRICPTHVGMNRKRAGGKAMQRDLPHARGDEPG